MRGEKKACGNWGKGKRKCAGDAGKGKREERPQAPASSLFSSFPGLLHAVSLLEELLQRGELNYDF